MTAYNVEKYDENLEKEMSMAKWAQCQKNEKKERK